MEWTDIRIIVPKQEADFAEAAVTSIANAGIYIEDYSDLEEEAMAIAHIDLIDADLLAKKRDEVIIHMYVSPDENTAEIIELLRDRLLGAQLTFRMETAGVQQEDWENGWKQYYHAMDVGERLAIVPSWEDYKTNRAVITLDPGMAFGTGTHETTSLCLTVLDKHIHGGERVLDIGTGSGILAIAALKLGAAEAEGVDIDPMCVRTAGENAARNGVQEHFKVLIGDLSDKASGEYDVICANIVANAIKALTPNVPPLLKKGGLYIASGIIDERRDEVLAVFKENGLTVQNVYEQRGWVALVATKA